MSIIDSFGVHLEKGLDADIDVYSPEETVREDVKILRDSSFFKGTQIVGLVQDTQTGLLKEVE